MIDQTTYDIMTAIKEQPGIRFNQMKLFISSSRTLARRLHQLQDLQLIQKISGTYHLSPKGVLVYENLFQIHSILEFQHSFCSEGFQRIALEPLRPLLWRYCTLLATHFAATLQTVILFGSMAKGQWTNESDVDLCVIVEDWQKPTWERTRELLKLRNQLRSTVEYHQFVQTLDFAPRLQHYPLTAQETARHHAVFPDLAFDGIILYEKERFGTQLKERLLQELTARGARRIQKFPTQYYWEGAFP